MLAIIWGLAGSLVAILILLYVAHLLASCQVYTDSCFWRVRSVCTDVGDSGNVVFMLQNFMMQKKFQQYFPCLMLGTYWMYVCLYVRTCMHIIYSELVWCKCCYIYLTVNWDDCTVYKRIFIHNNEFTRHGHNIQNDILISIPIILCYIFIHLSHVCIEDFHLCSFHQHTV